VVSIKRSFATCRVLRQFSAHITMAPITITGTEVARKDADGARR